MISKKTWIVFILCLAGALILFGKVNFREKPRKNDSTNISRQPETTIDGDAVATRLPGYVSVRMEKSAQPLVAGERGNFKIIAFINDSEKAQNTSLKWNQNAASPVTVWLASPHDSGIKFIDKNHPDRPDQHHLVRFDSPQNNDSEPLTATVDYIVKTDTKAGDHSFWLDISAELVTGDAGPKGEIHDVGVMKLPFKVDTHIKTKLLMLAVVAIAVFLFIVEWVRVDVVGILMMVLLPELNLINSHDAFRGLSSNAVIAIIGVMMISYGLNRTGTVGRCLHPLLKYLGKGASRVVAIFSGLIAVISSVMQNTGAAVLFLPAIRLVATRRLQIPISRILMPIGMAAILGGTITMIGTSPLILLNDILPKGMPKFSLFELTPIGLAIAAGGIFYLSTIGMYILSKNEPAPAFEEGDTCCVKKDEILKDYPLICGPGEIYVPEDYQAGSGPQELVNIRRQYLINIVAIGKDDGTHDIAPLPDTIIQPGFVLCVYGPEKAIREFTQNYGLVLREEPVVFKHSMFNPSIAGIVEIVISPRSSLIGETLEDVRFRETYEIAPLALHQAGKTCYRDMTDKILESGDTILVHGTWEHFHDLQKNHQNFIFITPFEDEFHKPEKAGMAVLGFSIALSLMVFSSFYFQNRSYNPIPLSICLMIGALFMIISKVMTITEAYYAVDWRTVFLLGGLIPLGMAVDQTGTAQWIAKGIITGLGSLMSPLLLLVILACLSCAFTMVISNVGACALLVPLGVSIATQIGMNPRAAVIVVGLGVSNSFILPTHQVNALYMGPGEYRSRDYVKIGGILSVVYIAILVSMTYLFYL